MLPLQAPVDDYENLIQFVETAYKNTLFEGIEQLFYNHKPILKLFFNNRDQYTQNSKKYIQITSSSIQTFTPKNPNGFDQTTKHS